MGTLVSVHFIIKAVKPYFAEHSKDAFEQV